MQRHTRAEALPKKETHGGKSLMKMLHNAGKFARAKGENSRTGVPKAGPPGGLKMLAVCSGGTKTAPGFWAHFWRRWQASFFAILAPGRLEKKQDRKSFQSRTETSFTAGHSICPTLTLKGLENIAYSRAHALLASHLPSALTIFCACIRNECRQRFLYERLQQQQTGQLQPSPGMQLRLLALGILLSKQKKQENAP